MQVNYGRGGVKQRRSYYLTTTDISYEWTLTMTSNNKY